LCCRAVAEQLLVVLCSLSDMLAEQDTQLLEQLHAGTVDLLLGELNSNTSADQQTSCSFSVVLIWHST
jgi:hypothetical protein